MNNYFMQLDKTLEEFEKLDDQFRNDLDSLSEWVEFTKTETNDKVKVYEELAQKLSDGIDSLENVKAENKEYLLNIVGEFSEKIHKEIKDIELYKQNIEQRVFKTLDDEKKILDDSYQNFYKNYQIKLSDLKNLIDKNKKKSNIFSLILLILALFGIVLSIIL